MFELSYLITTLFVFFTLITLFLVKHFTYWRRRGIPGPCRVTPEAMFSTLFEFMMKFRQKYGRIAGAYLFTRKFFILNEPELIRDIMTKDFHIFPDHYFMHMGSSKLQKALFFLKGDDEWKRIRSVVTPAFTSGKLRAMMANISQIADRFVKNLDVFAENGQTVDMRKYFGAFAMDVISTCAYGIDIESVNNPDNPIVVNAKKILSVDSSLSYIISVLIPPIGRLFKLEPFDMNAIKYFDDLTNKIVTERKKSTNNITKRRSDFIQLMIDNQKIDNKYDFDNEEELKETDSIISDKTKQLNYELTNDELTAQSILFFIAGYDTTSAALSHILYFLAKNTDCQQKLAEELNSLTEEFTYENLNELKYLNAVINETLRLAPPLICLQRECHQDYILGNTGITIPAGTTVEIQPFVIHRDPEYFPEPDQFKPERFIEPTHPSYAFIPFGGGPRLCVGMRFALNEMRMCIAKIIIQFEFTLIPGFNMNYFRGSPLLTPKEVMMNIKRRQN